jgi:hypothetical protein
MKALSGFLSNAVTHGCRASCWFVVSLRKLPCPAELCMRLKWRAPSYSLYSESFPSLKIISNLLITVVPGFESSIETSSNQIQRLPISSKIEMYTSISLLAGLAATVAAKTIVITAGSGGFAFSPSTVTAAVDDVLEFHFVGSIHSAVQGDFSSPCVQSSGGFDSGKITSVRHLTCPARNLS